MKIEFNNDEIEMLGAMVVAMGKDVESGLLEIDNNEMAERVKNSFLSLSNKVLMANFEMARESEGVMDAEILDEEE